MLFLLSSRLFIYANLIIFICILNCSSFLHFTFWWSDPSSLSKTLGPTLGPKIRILLDFNLGLQVIVGLGKKSSLGLRSSFILRYLLVVNWACLEILVFNEVKLFWMLLGTRIHSRRLKSIVVSEVLEYKCKV